MPTGPLKILVFSVNTHLGPQREGLEAVPPCCCFSSKNAPSSVMHSTGLLRHTAALQHVPALQQVTVCDCTVPLWVKLLGQVARWMQITLSIPWRVVCSCLLRTGPDLESESPSQNASQAQ